MTERLDRHRLGESEQQRVPPRFAALDQERPVRRRTDLVGFVNGIPLVFIELKAAHRNLKHAYDDNLRDYRDTIPHLFTPNGFIVLSNGAETKVGSITSAWEHFLEWKKINSEGEEGRVSLETVIRGMCTQERLLDIVEQLHASSKSCRAGSSSSSRATTSTSA